MNKLNKIKRKKNKYINQTKKALALSQKLRLEQRETPHVDTDLKQTVRANGPIDINGRRHLLNTIFFCHCWIARESVLLVLLRVGAAEIAEILETDMALANSTFPKTFWNPRGRWRHQSDNQVEKKTTKNCHRSPTSG